MNNLSLKSRAFLLTVLPIIIAPLFVAMATTYFLWMQQDKDIEEKGTALSIQISRFLGPLLNVELSERATRWINQGLSSSLEETSIRATSVYNAEGKRIAHSGPEFLFPLSETMPHIQSLPTKIVSKNSTLINHAYTSASNPSILGWIQVEVSHDAFNAKKYQLAFFILLISFIAIFASVGISIWNSRLVYRPLNRIRDALSKLEVGNLDVNITLDKSWVFHDLAENVNRTAAALRRGREDLKHHMEQANDDLRETLDTVEIQNVELNIARKEALEASKAKTEFLANTSHEIRTPINGIIGFTGLLSKTKLSSQQQEYLQTIQKSSQGLLTTINDILDVSKMENGQLVLDYNPFNLRDAIEDTLQVLALQAQQKKLQLITLIEPGLPLQILGDVLRLKQIINSLISNSIKFSEKGSIVISVSQLNTDDHQTQLKFSVIDQGLGISPEHQKTLFNAFTQVDTSNARRKGGVGLGLAVAKGLIQKMHGSIYVDSDIGTGSTFWFTAKFGIDRNAIFDVKETTKLAGKRVLVCDDNAMIVEQLKSYFNQWKVDYCVVSGEEGIKQAIEKESGARGFHSIIWDISKKTNARRWAEHNATFNSLKERQNKFVFLTMPGCDLDYDHDIDEQYAIFVHKPLTHDSIYNALLSLTIGPDERQQSGIVLDEKNKPKILAVDDNPANLQLIGELLLDLGAEVTLAKNGEEALQKYSPSAFDLVFMDIQMPGIDGLETTRRIRKLEKNNERTPVVALTAHAMTDQKAELLLSGMDDYLSKPVSEGQLIHIIQRWIYATHQTIPHAPRPEPLSPTISGQMTAIIENPVDLEKCLQLSNNKPQLAKDMLAMLLAALEQDKADIITFYKQQNFEALEKVVHKLNGGASYCGVPNLKMSSAKLDELLRNNNHNNIHHHVTNLLEAISQLLNWKEEYDLDTLFGLEETTSS